MPVSAFRFTVFLSLVVAILSLWDHPYLSYVKHFVVFIHELCHAIAAILSGGEVKNIQIHGNESGETIATIPKGNWKFLFIVSSGYLGTALLGGFLLSRGFKGTAARTTLLLFAFLVFILTLQYTKSPNLAHMIGLSSSFLLILVTILGRGISSLVLVFLGTSLCVYSVYDLSDFMEDIQSTDAGILASYLTGFHPEKSHKTPSSVILLGHLIGISWALISIFFIYNFIIKSFREDQATQLENPESTPDEMVGVVDPNGMFPGELTPEVLEWFLAKGLDLHGNPIPNSNPIHSEERVDGFPPNSEMT